MVCREMTEADIHRVIPLYIGYYNGTDGSCWTEATVYKRIHQVWSREDALCLIAESNGTVAGFIMGYFEQYDDLSAYDLAEIVIAQELQNKGLGREFMQELERRVKQRGGAMIQLSSENDEMHEHFYGGLGFTDAHNFRLKSKFL